MAERGVLSSWPISSHINVKQQTACCRGMRHSRGPAAAPPQRQQAPARARFVRPLHHCLPLGSVEQRLQRQELAPVRATCRARARAGVGRRMGSVNRHVGRCVRACARPGVGPMQPHMGGVHEAAACTGPCTGAPQVQRKAGASAQAGWAAAQSSRVAPSALHSQALHFTEPRRDGRACGVACSGRREAAGTRCAHAQRHSARGTQSPGTVWALAHVPVPLHARTPPPPP